MYVADITLRSSGDFVELHGMVHAQALAEPFDLWFRFPADYARFFNPENGSPFLAACLLPAMSVGERLELSLPVSQKLLQSIPLVQSVHMSWNPFLAYIDVRAQTWTGVARSGRETGLFFSTGVDSFYSLIRNSIAHPLNRDTIQHLLVLDGFPEIGNRKELFEQVLGNVHRIASHFSKRVLAVSTNVKDLMARFGVPWMFAHGAALASVGLALEQTFSKIYVPSTFSYAALYPMGTHPVLDPLWSSDLTEFIHDGCEATRLEKVRLISTHPIVLDGLRPCFSTSGGGFNCGRCVKCCQTMAQLHIAGALSRCRTFPGSVDVDAVRELSPLYRYQADACRTIAEELGSSADDEGIRAAFLEAAERGQQYAASFERARRTIVQRIAPGEKFILVDREAIRSDLGAGLRALPFMEFNGQYNGCPADGPSALRELLRLRQTGTRFAVFWRDAFWFFEAYPEMTGFLQSSCRRVAENESAVVYDLLSTPQKGV